MYLLRNDPVSVLMWTFALMAVMGLLWAVIRLGQQRPAGRARRLIGVGTTGYLAAASVSAVLRVHAAEATEPPVEPDPEVRISTVDPRQSVGADGKATDAKPPDEPAIDPAISGPPQRTGEAALRFANDVAKDRRCTEARAVAGAVRDLVAAAASEPRAKVDKAIERLEGCRKKIVWVKAASVRRKRIDARDAWVESLKTRMKTEGTPVFVSLRGAAHERIRLGGATPTVTKLRTQFDGTLRSELQDLGFAEVVFADMSTSERFELAVPGDHDLATRELASYKLDKPIDVP